MHSEGDVDGPFRRRPSTQGCTEWSCLYHGGDNRFKAGHREGCPVRESDWYVLDMPESENGPRCTCENGGEG